MKSNKTNYLRRRPSSRNSAFLVAFGGWLFIKPGFRLMLLILVGLAPARPLHAQQYTYKDLGLVYDPGYVGAYQVSYLGSASSFPAVVGWFWLSTDNYTNSHAAYWSAPIVISSGDQQPIDLSPTNLSGFTSSVAWGIGGNQQVGSGTIGANTHALLWTGTADSAVDLHPTNLPGGFTDSEAYRTNGTTQIGYGINGAGNYHALLWSGTANSAVDLHPTNIPNMTDSQGMDVSPDGSQAVGTGILATGQEHALLWKGANPATAIDLHPTLLTYLTDSKAISTNGTQQTGGGFDAAGREHALMWNGTAASAVDLTPQFTGSFTGYTDAVAYASNGKQQVGWVFNDNGYNGAPYNHAVVWSGTSGSAIDLGALVPYEEWSIAYGIDNAGNVYGLDSILGYVDVAEWSPVPEPLALSWLVCGVLLVRRRQPNRCEIRRICASLRG